MRTIRYSEEDIKRISGDTGFVTFSFSLADKFGDHGLISAIILQQKSSKEIFIDTWIMSCRVLKRGVEQFALSRLVNFAKDNNFELITGEYLPTPKNALVKDHYEELGFIKSNGSDGMWSLTIANYNPKLFYIHPKN